MQINKKYKNWERDLEIAKKKYEKAVEWNWKDWKQDWKWKYFYENWELEREENWENWNECWEWKYYDRNWELKKETMFY
jgi:antitoxin component YwqK of YwqJK toxin-antitoxin module